MTCSEDATLLKRFVEKDRIYELLVGLNIEFDVVRVQILGKEDLPSLNETLAIICVEQGRKKGSYARDSYSRWFSSNDKKSNSATS